MPKKQNDAELIDQYVSTQDPQIRDEIILRYVPLVHFVLGRLGLSKAMGPAYEDAASQGLVGLIESVDRYDQSFGTQFSTYATLRIRGKVIDYLRKLDWLPRGARKRARLVQEGIDELWEKLQRHPTEQEVAAHLSMDPSKVRQALIDSSRMIVSLDTSISALGDDDTSFHELIPDDSQVEPLDVVEGDELISIIGDGIKYLPQREQLILSLYYHNELTFKEIGKVLDISESRVCQLHGRIIIKLKDYVTQQSIIEAEEDIKPQEHKSGVTNPTGRVRATSMEKASMLVLHPEWDIQGRSSPDIKTSGAKGIAPIIILTLFQPLLLFNPILHKAGGGLYF